MSAPGDTSASDPTAIPSLGTIQLFRNSSAISAVPPLPQAHHSNSSPSVPIQATSSPSLIPVDFCSPSPRLPPLGSETLQPNCPSDMIAQATLTPTPTSVAVPHPSLPDSRHIPQPSAVQATLSPTSSSIAVPPPSHRDSLHIPQPPQPNCRPTVPTPTTSASPAPVACSTYRVSSHVPQAHQTNGPKVVPMNTSSSTSPAPNTYCPPSHPIPLQVPQGPPPNCPQAVPIKSALSLPPAPGAFSSPSNGTYVQPAHQGSHSLPQHDTSPTTPSPFSRCKPLIRSSDPAIDQYWRRLHVLLRSAHQTSSDLRPLGIAVPPTEKAVSAHIAFDLQGRFGCECDEQVKTYASKPEYLKVYTSRAVGDFVEYGVQGTHAVWVVQCLASVGLPLKAPKGDTPVIIGETHADLGVEEVRVRVFEAEVSCLPLPFLERLLKVRKTMRRFKQRIDLCTRILLALEGRGRRVAQPGLDKLKLSLEKADMLAGQERVKGEAAEAARVSKEKKSRELARVKQEKAQKVSELKKRKRQENAQASFMMRFVKPKSGDSHETDRKSGSNHFKRTISETNFPSLLALRSPEGVYAANIPSDLDVMSASWWLRCLMNAVPQAVMDNGFSQSPSSGPLQPSSLRELLLSSANRRRDAEGKIHALLKDYRRQRKIHIEDRTPRFVSKRKTVRGVGLLGAIKLLQFDENHRPAFFGTLRLCSSIVCARRPFAKDNALNYTYDSEDDWEEEDEGEDLVDVEAEKELDNEDAELRKLYGSDEEDDDDFLDDEDADEDDEEELDNEGDITMVCSDAGKVGSLQPSEVSENRPISDINVGSNNPEKNNLSPVEKRTIVKGAIKRNGKRRKRNMKQSVVIHGMEPHNDGVSSSLASYPVTMFGDAPPIQMFNPFVYNASDIVSEHLKSKPPSVPRVMRPSSMDDSAKLDLAIALMRTGSSKDKIILQFCERRKIRGLQVPAKSEILRALGEIARREKRDGDTRAGWYLNDKSLAQKVEQMSTVSQETSEIPFVHEPSAVGE